MSGARMHLPRGEGLDRTLSGDGEVIAIFPDEGQIAGQWIRSDYAIPEGDWR